MKFMNQRKCTCNYVKIYVYNYIILIIGDLDEQFTQVNLKCVLDYMAFYLDEMDFIFRNYTVVFKHVFEGLSFLGQNGIIHRDVKCT